MYKIKLPDHPGVFLMHANFMKQFKYLAKSHLSQ